MASSLWTIPVVWEGLHKVGCDSNNVILPQLVLWGQEQALSELSQQYGRKEAWSHRLAVTRTVPTYGSASSKRWKGKSLHINLSIKSTKARRCFSFMANILMYSYTGCWWWDHCFTQVQWFWQAYSVSQDLKNDDGIITCTFFFYTAEQYFCFKRWRIESLPAKITSIQVP